VVARQTEYEWHVDAAGRDWGNQLWWVRKMGTSSAGDRSVG